MAFDVGRGVFGYKLRDYIVSPEDNSKIKNVHSFYFVLDEESCGKSCLHIGKKIYHTNKKYATRRFSRFSARMEQKL